MILGLFTRGRYMDRLILAFCKNCIKEELSQRKTTFTVLRESQIPIMLKTVYLYS